MKIKQTNPILTTRPQNTLDMKKDYFNILFQATMEYICIVTCDVTLKYPIFILGITKLTIYSQKLYKYFSQL